MPRAHAGNWSEQLLRSMYEVTAQHGAAFSAETERLWATVAGNRRNVIPILDFLISRGLQEAAHSIAHQQARALHPRCTPAMHRLVAVAPGVSVHAGEACMRVKDRRPAPPDTWGPSLLPGHAEA